MLPSSKRLSISLFTEVLTKGKMIHSPLFTARILKMSGPSRFAAVISKKIAKTAVERNKLRRRIYSAVGVTEAGFHVLLMAKPTIKTAKLGDIAADLRNLFVKSGLLK